MRIAEYYGCIGSEEGLSRDRVLWEMTLRELGFTAQMKLRPVRYVLRADRRKERGVCPSGYDSQDVEIEVD